MRYDETNDRFISDHHIAREISAANLHDGTSTRIGLISGRRARGLLNNATLTKAQIESDTSVVKGTVDGKLINEAIDERLTGSELSDQDENRLEQIPRLSFLTDDIRDTNVARVWEAPANSNHGMAVFTGLTTPTDSELEAATYVTPLTTAANTTTRILVVKVDLGDHPGDIRIRETGLPSGQTFIITGSLFYLLT